MGMELGHVTLMPVGVVLHGCCCPASTLNMFSGEYRDLLRSSRLGGHLDEVRVDGRPDSGGVAIDVSSLVSFRVEVCEVSGTKYALL